MSVMPGLPRIQVRSTWEDVHVYLRTQRAEHELDGKPCPCEPRMEVVQNDAGEVVGRVFVHGRIQ